MKMEQNGKASSGKRTRHINIRYFFISDGIAKKEVAIQYCLTNQSRFYRKPPISKDGIATNHGDI
jgi:hypothetical protein